MVEGAGHRKVRTRTCSTSSHPSRRSSWPALRRTRNLWYCFRRRFRVLPMRFPARVPSGDNSARSTRSTPTRPFW